MSKKYGDILQLFKATKGVNFENIPLNDKVKSTIAILLGAELSLFGIYHKIINLSLIIAIYIYYNIVELIKHIHEYLLGMNNDMCTRIANFMTESSIHEIVIFIVFLFIVSTITFVALKFFTKAAVLAASIFLFSFGPFAQFMSGIGIENPTVHLLFGVILGILVIVFLNEKIINIILIFLFSSVGISLILLGVGQLNNIHFKWCYKILKMEEPAELEEKNPVEKEMFFLGVFILISFTAQMFFYYFHKKK